MNLPARQNFSTKQGSDGTPIMYTVITSLGSPDDATTGSNQTLQGMARTENLSGYFVLGSNIDATPTATWNSDGQSSPSYSGFMPIGSWPDNRFIGNFDGLGHTINGITINRPSTDYVGLFGYTGYNIYTTLNSAITNVGINGGNITGQKYVCGLVGESTEGTITNSYTTGNVTGNGNDVGGLSGFNYGGLPGSTPSPITNCYTTGTVTGTGHVGGLVGVTAMATLVSLLIAMPRVT